MSPFVLIVALFAHTPHAMTALPMPSRLACEEARRAMPASERVQWTACVLVAGQ